MTSRIEKMLAKTQGIRAAKDIPANEIPSPSGPKTAVGTMAAWQAAQLRIQELEASGPTSIVATALISPNPWQPRKVFDPVEIQKLADSIAAIGLIQPITVRKKSVSNVDTFELVAGERRLRANQLLGVTEIKVVVIDVSDEDMALMALAENIDRVDLTDYEISKSIIRVQDQFKTVKKLAEAIGVARTDLYRFLDFANLPDFVTADLDIKPSLLGRAAASEIVRKLKDYGAPAQESFKAIWPRLKSGDLDQGKIASTIEASIKGRVLPRTDRDIKKLFIGKEQAGSIKRDADIFQVTIKTAALSPEREAELRAFLERMFAV